MNVGEWLAMQAMSLIAVGNSVVRVKIPIAYVRPDGAEMVEVAPNQYVNKDAAITLGLVRQR